MLFMLNQVVIDERMMKGIYMKFVFCSQMFFLILFLMQVCVLLLMLLSSVLVMMMGIMNWVSDIFRLLMFVFMLVVKFFLVLGKKKLMLDMLELKLLLFSLYSRVKVSSVGQLVDGLCSVKFMFSVGISSEVVLIVVQWWLLKIGIRKEQKMCSVVLDKVGSVVSQNIWFLESWKLVLLRLMMIMFYSIQMLKVSIRVGIDSYRLWLVICVFWVCQKVVFLGFQCVRI